MTDEKPDLFPDVFPEDGVPRIAPTPRLPREAWVTETTHRDGQQE